MFTSTHPRRPQPACGKKRSGMVSAWETRDAGSVSAVLSGSRSALASTQSLIRVGRPTFGFFLLPNFRTTEAARDFPQSGCAPSRWRSD